jgi:hypothetical protein
MGLIDVNQLAVAESSRPFEPSSRGWKGEFAPPSRGQSAPFARGSHPNGNAVSINNGNGSSDLFKKSLKNAHIGAGEINGVRQCEEVL